MKMQSNVRTPQVLFAVMILSCVYFQVKFMTRPSNFKRNNFKIKPKRTWSATKLIESSQTLSICENFLQNMTSGYWTSLPNTNTSKLDADYLYYWRKRGILNFPWRDDKKCGYENVLSEVVGSGQPARPGWCDRRSSKPCCNDKQNGICSIPSEQTCDCDRKYMYAELAEWKTFDPRCQWQLYNATEACEVIDKSEFNDIRFIGDSLVRNMFAAFVTLLSGDRERGAWGKEMTGEQRDKCVGVSFYFWDFCRSLVFSLNDSYQEKNLCGGKSHKFAASANNFYSMTERFLFHDEVKGLVGKQGSLVIVGVGLHMNLNPEALKTAYLDPAIQLRETFYKDTQIPQEKRWPQFIFILPLLPGLLKPLDFFKVQNDQVVTRFADGLREYLDQYKIPVFDFRNFSKMVHSFDGTHHGLGVNLMKNQFLLNYIANAARPRSDS